VKELKLGQNQQNWAFNLRREAENYEALLPANPPHIVTLRSNPGGTTATDENLGANWDDVVRRLFFEYWSWDL